MERILELLKEQGKLPEQPVPDAYAVVPDASSLSQVMPVLRTLRLAGVNVQMHAGGPEGMGSMKSQFKKADASGARFALIFGQAELEQGAVADKPLRGSRTGADVGEPAQQLLKPLAEAAQWASALQMP
jgi:histidyl-tRNA synthetase